MRKRKKKIFGLAVCMACASLALFGCGGEKEEEKVKETVTQTPMPEDGAQTPVPEDKTPTTEPEATPTSEATDETEKATVRMEEKMLYENGALFAKQTQDGWIFTNGQMRLEYDVNAGTAQIFTEGEELPLLCEVYAKTVLKDGTEFISKDLKRDGENSITVKEVADGFGEGMQIRIVNAGEAVELTQCYSFYEGLPYFFCEAVVGSKIQEEISTNYIAPIFACKGDYKTCPLGFGGGCALPFHAL